MSRPVSRRDAIRQLSAAGAVLLPGKAAIRGHAGDIVIAGEPAEIAIRNVSPSTVRITVSPLHAGHPVPVARTGALDRPDVGSHVAHGRKLAPLDRVRSG